MFRRRRGYRKRNRDEHRFAQYERYTEGTLVGAQELFDGSLDQQLRKMWDESPVRRAERGRKGKE